MYAIQSDAGISDTDHGPDLVVSDDRYHQA
jgi:hypothetical protein